VGCSGTPAREPDGGAGDPPPSTWFSSCSQAERVLPGRKGRRAVGASSTARDAAGFAPCEAPKLLLYGEPTEGIQPSVIDQIEDASSGFRDRRISVLLVGKLSGVEKKKKAWRLSFRLCDHAQSALIVSRGSTKDSGEDMVRQHLTV